MTVAFMGAAVSHGVRRTPASMSRSIQMYVPFFRPDGDEDAAHPDGEGPLPAAKAGEVQQAEEPDPREDREGDHQVLRVPIRNQDARGGGDSDSGGSEERDEPAIHLKPVREEIAERPARGRERQEEDQRDEVEEADRGHPKRRPRDPDDDRDHADYEDRPEGRRVCDRGPAERRIPRPIPPRESASHEDDPSKENQARRKQGEQRPPRLDV